MLATEPEGYLGALWHPCMVIFSDLCGLNPLARSGNSRTVVLVPTMKRLVLGNKLFAPAGEAISLSHQSGHDDLHLSVLSKYTNGASQPRA
jgi:hypothetical protein